MLAPARGGRPAGVSARLRAPCLALMLLVAPCAAAAETETANAPDASEQRLQRQAPVRTGLTPLEAPLTLNGRLLGEIRVSVTPDGQGEIDAVRLIALLQPVLDPSALTELQARIGGRQTARFEELSTERLAIAFDPGSLEVKVQPGEAALALQEYRLRGLRDPDPSAFVQPADVAAALSVALEQVYVHDGPAEGRSPLIAFADGFVTLGGFAGTTLRFSGQWSELGGGRERWRRGPAQLVRDDYRTAVRTIAGEFTPSVTAFQGAGPMLGATVERDYGRIRPFQNIVPSGREAVTLERPGVVIVDVNGVETRRLRLQPGRYTLSELSTDYGSKDVRLSVEDSVGRREVALLSYFTGPSLLEVGLSEFSAAAGVREGRERGEYDGPFMLSGFYRRGVRPSLTLGGGAQYADGAWQVSAEATVGTRLGLFRGSAAASQLGGSSGYAAAIDWQHQIDTRVGEFSFSLSAASKTENFGSPFEREKPFLDERFRLDGRVDWRRAAFGATLSAGALDSRGLQPDRRYADITLYSGVGRYSGSLTVGAEKEGRGDWEARVLVGLSVRLHDRSTVNARADTRRSAAALEYFRFPRDDIGDLSGRAVVGRSDDSEGIEGELRYFGNRFIGGLEHRVSYARSATGVEQNLSLVRFAMGAAFAGGHLAVGRPVSNGFVIFPRHRTLSDSHIRIFDEIGYQVGRRDLLGPPLVPLDRNYRIARYEIEVDPLPEGYDIGEGALTIFPSAASGYVSPIGSDASRYVVGRLETADGPVANLAGQVEKEGDPSFEPRPFFTNSSGRFAADRLSPGRYRLMIGGAAAATFEVPEDSQGVINVGVLRTSLP